MSRYQHSQAESRIRAALGKMPYGGRESLSSLSRHVGFRNGTPAPIEFDDLAEYLEKLGEVLDGVATEGSDRARRLAELERDLAGVRRIFGFGSK